MSRAPCPVALGRAARLTTTLRFAAATSLTRKSGTNRARPYLMKEVCLLRIALWTIAGLLAAVFILAGTNKLVIPWEKLTRAPGGGWVEDFSSSFVKALGAVELLGAIGLILPGLADVAPVLVPVAASGLGLIMIGAATVECRRREFRHVSLNVIYLVLIVFLAWGRFGPVPFR